MRAYNETELYHYGVKGMKWGVRRYQNKNGGLKSADKKRVIKGENKKAVKRAKEERKKRINKEYKKLQSKSTSKDRFIYNDATRRKAAKYIVDNNMTVKEATEKAKGEAKRNTAIILGLYGAMTLSGLYIQNKQRNNAYL